MELYKIIKLLFLRDLKQQTALKNNGNTKEISNAKIISQQPKGALN